MCITLVVIGHAAFGLDYNFPLQNGMSTFRMPLYFVLSGVFFKTYSGFCEFLIKKTNRLLIPCIFFTMVGILIPFIFSFFFTPTYSVWSLDFFFPLYYETDFAMMSGHLWFLWCLFFDNLTFYAVYSLCRSDRYSLLHMIVICTGIGILGFMLNYDLHVNIYMFVDSSLSTTPFFLFGYLLRDKTNILYSSKFDKYAQFFSIFVIVFIFLYARKYIDYRGNRLGDSFIYVLWSGCLGALAFIFLAKRIKKLPFFSYIGRYSIITLIFHYPLITAMVLLKPYIPWINGYERLYFMLTIFVVLFLCYIITPPVIKYMPYVTAQKDLIKYQKT